MPEEVLFKHESQQSRSEVAAYLRAVADKLDGNQDLTLEAGDEQITVDVPETLEFEVKAERETGSGPNELSVEFELEWDEGANGGELDIS